MNLASELTNLTHRTSTDQQKSLNNTHQADIITNRIGCDNRTSDHNDALLDENQVAAAVVDAKVVVQRHIKLLHEYNAIKDTGQGLLGLIADSRGVRLRDVHDEFGVGSDD